MVSWQVFMNILVCLLFFFFFFFRVVFWIYFSLLTKKKRKKRKNYLQLSKPQLRMSLSRIVGNLEA